MQVSGLNSGRGLIITLYAVNANGRSKSTVIEGFTLKVAQLQVGKSYNVIFSKQYLLQYVFIISYKYDISIRNKNSNFDKLLKPLIWYSKTFSN